MSENRAQPTDRTLKAADLVPFLKESLGPVIAEQVDASIKKAREENDKNPGASADAWVKALRAAQTGAPTVAVKGGVGAHARAVGKNGPGLSLDPARYLSNLQSFSKTAYDTTNEFATQRKALGESLFIDGGAIVPPAFTEEVIEFLRSKVVVRALGARVIPMPRGTMTMPYASQGILASNAIENTVTNPSLPQFGTFTLSAKKIRAITPISNDLLSDASPQADLFVQQDLVAALRLQEETNFIRGTGVNGQMRGLRSLAQNTFHATNSAGTAGNSTTTEIIHDLVAAIALIEGNNIQIEKGGWIMAPRTKWALMSLRDGVGNFYFKQEMLQGRLWGYEYGSTTIEPVNLDTTSGALSAKESELIFADFDRIIIGDTQELTIMPFLGGAYYDNVSAQIVSGISNDQTVVVGQLRTDINARYRGLEITQIDQITWGA